MFRRRVMEMFCREIRPRETWWRRERKKGRLTATSNIAGRNYFQFLCRSPLLLLHQALSVHIHCRRLREKQLSLCCHWNKFNFTFCAPAFQLISFEPAWVGGWKHLNSTFYSRLLTVLIIVQQIYLNHSLTFIHACYLIPDYDSTMSSSRKATTSSTIVIRRDIRRLRLHTMLCGVSRSPLTRQWSGWKAERVHWKISHTPIRILPMRFTQQWIQHNFWAFRWVFPLAQQRPREPCRWWNFRT